MSNQRIGFSFNEEEFDLIDKIAFEHNISRNKVVKLILKIAFDNSITLDRIDGEQITLSKLTKMAVRFLLWRENNISTGITIMFNNLHDFLAYNNVFPDKS